MQTSSTDISKWIISRTCKYSIWLRSNTTTFQSIKCTWKRFAHTTTPSTAKNWTALFFYAFPSSFSSYSSSSFPLRLNKICIENVGNELVTIFHLCIFFMCFQSIRKMFWKFDSRTTRLGSTLEQCDSDQPGKRKNERIKKKKSWEKTTHTHNQWFENPSIAMNDSERVSERVDWMCMFSAFYC